MPLLRVSLHRQAIRQWWRATGKQHQTLLQVILSQKRAPGPHPRRVSAIAIEPAGGFKKIRITGLANPAQTGVLRWGYDTKYGTHFRDAAFSGVKGFCVRLRAVLRRDEGGRRRRILSRSESPPESPLPPLAMAIEPAVGPKEISKCFHGSSCHGGTPVLGPTFPVTGQIGHLLLGEAVICRKRLPGCLYSQSGVS